MRRGRQGAGALTLLTTQSVPLPSRRSQPVRSDLAMTLHYLHRVRNLGQGSNSGRRGRDICLSLHSTTLPLRCTPLQRRRRRGGGVSKWNRGGHLTKPNIRHLQMCCRQPGQHGTKSVRKDADNSKSAWWHMCTTIQRVRQKRYGLN
jgi:hypothetical protein